LWQEADELHAQLSPDFFRCPDVGGGQQRAASVFADAQDTSHEAILVADDCDGQVCGALHLLLYDTPMVATMTTQRRGHVESLIVAGAHRRSGCGSALMRAATEWARRSGATQLLLTVWAGNREAQRFYAALGYRTISRVLGIDL
jgi:ribosomal protein S18 acetylase RimI-like enzyme